MADAELSRIIETRAVSAEMRPTGESEVLAVDVFEPWAAVFRFRVSPNGDAETDVDIAKRGDDGWEWLSGGGSSGAGWPIPWVRPTDGWNGDHLRGGGLCGLDIEDDYGVVCGLMAVSGFASARTDSILVECAGTVRTVVPAPTGAYVVVAIGRGWEYLELTPMEDGNPLSRTRSYPGT